MARSPLGWIGLIIGSTVAAALISLLAYDMLQFQPRRHEIDELLATARPVERNPPELVAELQRADAAGRIALLATRSLLNELDRSSPGLPTLVRKRREMLWIQLLRIHLSEEEQFLIARRLAPFGKHVQGYEAGAQSVFGRSLDELRDLELAELVVIARWPTKYRDPGNADAVRRAAHALLAQCLSRS